MAEESGSNEGDTDQSHEICRILEDVMQFIQEGIAVVYGYNAKVRMISDYGCRLLGRTREELTNATSEELPDKWGFFHNDNLTPALSADLPLTRSMAGGEIINNEEWLVKRGDGEVRVFSFNSAPMFDGDKKIIGAVSGWRDITEQKKIQDTLRRNEYELRTLIDSTPDIIMRVGKDMRYVFVNPAYERITGIPKEQFIGKTNAELGMAKENSVHWDEEVRKAFEIGRESSIEFDFPGLFGKRFFWGRIIPEYDKGGMVESVLIIARDITDRKRAEEQIRYISFHDKVTGLYNRAYFEEELRRLDTERSLPICIIMGDVNNLKLVNDAFGHNEGDKLLVALAGILNICCRKEDIIARWGGDEFSVILPQTDMETAQTICERIKRVSRASRGMLVKPSIALGVSVKARADQNLFRVIREAEERMYDNKLAESALNREMVIDSLIEEVRDRTNDMKMHIARCRNLASIFGKALKLSDTQIHDLQMLIRLHDIGKVAVPAGILRKPGRLTFEEWEIIKRHSETGYRIAMTFSETARIAEEILAHAERWDGTGYPRGLKEKNITYLSRVFSIIDIYDVITNARPYGRILSHDDAIGELRHNARRQFDPELLEVFIASGAGRLDKDKK